MIAFNRNLPSTWRKEYRGNAAANIAVMNVSNGAIQEVTNTDLQQFKTFANNVFPMWGADGMIYFASERDGTFNLWRMSTKGGNAQQVTNFKSRAASSSPPSRPTESTSSSRTSSISTRSTFRTASAKKLDAGDVVRPEGARRRGADRAKPRRGVRHLAEPATTWRSTIHGEIMIVPTEAGVGEKTQMTNSAWRERNEDYSPDGRKIAYVSDEGGEQQVWVYDVASATRKKLHGAAGEKDNLRVGAELAKARVRRGQQGLRGRRRRRRSSRARAQRRRRDHRLAVLGRRQLARLQPTRRRTERRRLPLRHQDARTEYNISQSPWNETNAQLTPDGKTVVFTSNRDGGSEPALRCLAVAHRRKIRTTRWCVSVSVARRAARAAADEVRGRQRGFRRNRCGGS